MDATTTVAAPEQPAPPIDELLELSVPVQVARDAVAIMDAALVAEPVLTEPQQAMLDFERQWWKRGGAKEQAIRDTFGMTPTRYYQDLNGVLELPAAMVYDAALVHRLRRVRA